MSTERSSAEVGGSTLPTSAPWSVSIDDVTVRDSRIHRIGDPRAGETYRDILSRYGLESVETFFYRRLRENA